MEQKTSQSASSTSPQKQMKSRSKSTEEMQHSRKAFSSQKSLPGRPELDKVKECFEGSDTPLASTEELNSLSKKDDNVDPTGAAKGQRNDFFTWAVTTLEKKEMISFLRRPTFVIHPLSKAEDP